MQARTKTPPGKATAPAIKPVKKPSNAGKGAGGYRPKKLLDAGQGCINGDERICLLTGFGLQAIKAMRSHT